MRKLLYFNYKIRKNDKYIVGLIILHIIASLFIKSISLMTASAIIGFITISMGFVSDLYLRGELSYFIQTTPYKRKKTYLGVTFYQTITSMLFMSFLVITEFLKDEKSFINVAGIIKHYDSILLGFILILTLSISILLIVIKLIELFTLIAAKIDKKLFYNILIVIHYLVIIVFIIGAVSFFKKSAVASLENTLVITFLVLMLLALVNYFIYKKIDIKRDKELYRLGSA